MLDTVYLDSLEFMSFERYPEQHKPVLLRCEGIDKVTEEHVRRYVRMKDFDATTFNPNKMLEIFKNKNVDWDITWLPVEKMEKKYD